VKPAAFALERDRRPGDGAARDVPRTARDCYLAAHRHAVRGEFQEALALAETATRKAPNVFSAWLVRAYCHENLAQYREAVGCYGTCLALHPDDALAWFARGSAYLKQRRFRAALDDLDRAVELRPGLTDAYIHRALAKEGLSRFAEAVGDLTEAIRRGTPRTQVYFLRASAREKAGDREGARQDRAEGLRWEPSDEEGWVTRGVARLAGDPRGSLADFDRALGLNPRSAAALQNKAHVLAERLGRTDEAVRALDRAVELYPDFVPSRVGRAVLLARLGRREQAHADARAALDRDATPPTLYQAANVYALTARRVPGDRLQALPLLARALQGGFGLDVIDSDTDMDPLRDDPDFRRLVKAARELQMPPRKGGRE
jgi:Tfp pilus assembly protein PilF